jgi:hypothetical protein
VSLGAAFVAILHQVTILTLMDGSCVSMFATFADLDMERLS